MLTYLQVAWYIFYRGGEVVCIPSCKHPGDGWMPIIGDFPSDTKLDARRFYLNQSLIFTGLLGRRRARRPVFVGLLRQQVRWRNRHGEQRRRSPGRLRDEGHEGPALRVRKRGCQFVMVYSVSSSSRCGCLYFYLRNCYLCWTVNRHTWYIGFTESTYWSI